MAKKVTQTFNNPSEYSYTEFAAGELVFADPMSPGSLDTERIYQVESFTPPQDIKMIPAGMVKLKHRPTPVYGHQLRVASEEEFNSVFRMDQQHLEFFLAYLSWVKQTDRFS